VSSARSSALLPPIKAARTAPSAALVPGLADYVMAEIYVIRSLASAVIPAPARNVALGIFPREVCVSAEHADLQLLASPFPPAVQRSVLRTGAVVYR